MEIIKKNSKFDNFYLLIKSNHDPSKLFNSLHKSFKIFVSKWTKNMKKEMYFQIKKKSFETMEIAPLMDELPQNEICEEIKANCAYCGTFIEINSELQECRNCTSKHFLIGNQFALIKVVAQGGFGRVYKAKHKKTGMLVAIKERLKESEKEIFLWKKEIEILKKIEKEIYQACISRLICVMDDTVQNLPQKYTGKKKKVIFILKFFSIKIK
jgi:hypothetical protein